MVCRVIAVLENDMFTETQTRKNPPPFRAVGWTSLSNGLGEMNKARTFIQNGNWYPACAFLGRLSDLERSELYAIVRLLEKVYIDLEDFHFDVGGEE